MESFARFSFSRSGNTSLLLPNTQNKKASRVKLIDCFHCLPFQQVENYFLKRATRITSLPFQVEINKTSSSQVWHSSTEAPSDFFPHLSKQNYYSPGNRAVQTQAPHQFAPPWDIPWKWLSLSSAASSVAGHMAAEQRVSGCSLPQERARFAAWLATAESLVLFFPAAHKSQTESHLEVYF